MYVFRTMTSYRMLFWKVPVSLDWSTPCSLAATMYIASTGITAPFTVIVTVSVFVDYPRLSSYSLSKCGKWSELPHSSYSVIIVFRISSIFLILSFFMSFFRMYDSKFFIWWFQALAILTRTSLTPEKYANCCRRCSGDSKNPLTTSWTFFLNPKFLPKILLSCF